MGKTDKEAKDLLTYSKELRKNLQLVWEKTVTSLREAQEKQKKGYNTRSVLRTLNVGDKALVLLPSSENKLLAQWQGPYEVVEQINPTTYKLSLPHKHGREQIYHINLLKKWQEPVSVQTVQHITTDTKEDIL
ncbi:hypothetical protein NDU88_000001 [Pleurodeles waltl]|uniref:Integrase p58-like C-terminal domain-containing protein n=1 Tax=Pleurodeles waltl TaxID=8319 RepID=A0AAV7Q2J1_PLEWA|nr:hypothetical protein NDU88_000001 [Pleurodeles waltl]